MYTHNSVPYIMGNSGTYKLGHTESPQEKVKRVAALTEAWKTRADRHGMMGTKFHNTWRSMTTRCRGTCGKDSKKKYLDKGITVCERWLKFKNFYEDMYPSYVEGLTIDRIENSKGYYKENCRWATPLEQNYNTSKTIFIEYQGKRMHLLDWASHFGISLNGLKIRYHRKYKKGLITADQLFHPLKPSHTYKFPVRVSV